MSPVSQSQGAGVVGCETAEFLARQGKKVTITEMLPDIAGDMEPICRRLLRERLQDLSVMVMTNSEIIGIAEEGVLLKTEQKSVEADSVVLAAGSQPNIGLEKELTKAGFRVHTIGDCLEPRKIIDAIHEGFEVGLKL